ncbi:MAG TPA: reverse transcriptase domain-containing protein [Kofleriaceae bacterium]|nr:reverse transcriptase domain-containing protein [Kofleriaceae bacterium]
MSDDLPPRDRRQLYERIARGGKEEAILDEMVRLGFWSGDKPPAHDPPDEVRRRGELRARLDGLRQSAAKLRDLAQLEIELKKQRMAESRRRREETKQRRLGERAAARAETQEKKTRELTYLGARVSAGLGPAPGRREGNAARLGAQRLPVLHTAAELAAAIGVSLGELRFLAFAREVSTTTHYRRFTIPKRAGGERVISAPMRRLKRVQRWILDHLLEAVALAEPAHGFRTGRSIVSNAAPHAGSAIVVNVDLRDFFPTVTYRRVKGLFGKLGYSEEVATVLALLCTEPEIAETTLDGITYYVARGERRLPQGAPTSPAITNALCRRLDRRIAGWAARHGFLYTRYADDLTLSTKHGDARVGSCLAFLRRVTAAEGFQVHPDKVRVVRRGRRQEVTGIVVNERPAVPRVELRKFRALLHHLEKDGPAGKTWGTAGGTGSAGAGGGTDVLAAALGFASFVAMVDPAKGEPLRARVLALRAKHRP